MSKIFIKNGFRIFYDPTIFKIIIAHMINLLITPHLIEKQGITTVG